MKKIIYFLVTLLLLTGCQNKVLSESEEFNIVVASDIHYFLKEYYEECAWFEENIRYGDGKMVTYADEILDAFVLKVSELKPDLLLLTGDLSFNGEVGSHKGLAQILKKLDDQGIHVAVLPGNHDIDYLFTKGYGKDDYFEVANVSASEFKEIYKDLGYDIAYHQHKESLSYSIALNELYTLILLDSNSHELTTGTALDTGGSLTESTIEWLEKELKEVKNNNKRPIVAMHHNLGVHNSLLNSGYTIKDNLKIAELLKQYDVKYVFTGHIHCQSITNIEGIYDIASESLLDAPLQFGKVKLSEQEMNYSTDHLDISISSNDYFDMVSRNRLIESFETVEDEVKKEAMIDVVVKANRYYFSGTISKHIDEIKNMKGYAYFQNDESQSFRKQYLDSMMENPNDDQSLVIKY